MLPFDKLKMADLRMIKGSGKMNHKQQFIIEDLVWGFEKVASILSFIQSYKSKFRQLHNSITKRREHKKRVLKLFQNPMFFYKKDLIRL